MKTTCFVTRAGCTAGMFGFCLLLLSPGAADLKADVITPGTPTSGGVDFVWIHDNAGWHIVPVDITAGMSQAEKTVAIATAVQQDFDASSGENPSGTGHVDIAAGKNGLDKWVYHSHTGETDQAGLATAASVSVLGFDGSLSGIAYAGHTASYNAEIDFNSVTATSSVLFSSLANPSINGLLTATYNNLEAALPAAFRSNLVLDLTGGDLMFTAPPGAINAAVSTQSLDVAVGSFVGGAATAPEPSSWVFLIIGASAIFAGSLRRTTTKRH